MAGFIIKVTSSNKWWYLLGTILVVALGIGMAIGGFASGTTAVGIIGIAVGVVGVVLLIDAIANL